MYIYIYTVHMYMEKPRRCNVVGSHHLFNLHSIGKMKKNLSFHPRYFDIYIQLGKWRRNKFPTPLNFTFHWEDEDTSNFPTRKIQLGKWRKMAGPQHSPYIYIYIYTYIM